MSEQPGVQPMKIDPALVEFLDYLYGEQVGYVYSPAIGDAGFGDHYFEWPKQKADLVKHIIKRAPHQDVYVAPAMFKTKSGKKEDVLGSRVVWADLDGNASIINNLGEVPPPSVRIASSLPGVREHWYWTLEAFTTSIKAIEAINRSLAHQLGADNSGWDANQVLRPPGTRNHKRDKPVEVAYNSDVVYSKQAFGALPATPEPTVQVEQEAVPDVFDVIAKHAWPNNAINFFRQNDVEVGKRSSALMAMAYYCAEMGLSDVESFAILRNCDDRWGKFKDRTDRAKQLERIIHKARTKYPVEKGTQLEQHESDALPVYGFKSLLESNIEVRWVIENFLEEAGYMLLTGPSGVGKTQLTLRFAIALALGRPFLDYPVIEPQKLLFFSLEMGHAPLKHFLQTMSPTLTADEIALLEKNLIFVPLGEPLEVDKAADQARVEELLAYHKPTGYFIDSIGSMSDEDLNEKTAKALMGWTDRTRRKYNVFAWYIHHNRKAQSDNKKPKSLADVYGNQYVVNRATSVFGLWPTGNGVEISSLKVRLGPGREPFVVVRTADLDFIVKVKVGLVDKEKDEPVVIGFEDNSEPVAFDSSNTLWKGI